MWQTSCFDSRGMPVGTSTARCATSDKRRNLVGTHAPGMVGSPREEFRQTFIKSYLATVETARSEFGTPLLRRLGPSGPSRDAMQRTGLPLTAARCDVALVRELDRNLAEAQTLLAEIANAVFKLGGYNPLST